MAESSDAQLQLKKRARRRLVGAIAFAGLAAVVLPMVMDEEPKQQVQDVQIRIPGQDQTPFAPKALIAKPAVSPGQPVDKTFPSGKVDAASGAPVAKMADAPPVQVAAKPVEKAAEKTVDKKTEKPVEKPVEKPPATKAVKAPADDTQRAVAILGGKAAETPVAANGGGQYVILIGAFANPANVKQLQGKISELGVKTFTEPLDSPQGKKTRVRAGPFPNRDAADKALERMKRIGVSGVVAAK